MLIAAFAFDYDGTIAENGQVDEATVAALSQWPAVLTARARFMSPIKCATDSFRLNFGTLDTLFPSRCFERRMFHRFDSNDCR